MYRPVIPFRVQVRERELSFAGLLDTGADETLVTREVADVLGIEPISPEQSIVLSASGEMPVSYGRVVLEVSQGDEIYRWPAVVGIVDEPWTELLLGHAGFLEFFDSTFFGSGREVSLVRNARSLPKAL